MTPPPQQPYQPYGHGVASTFVRCSSCGYDLSGTAIGGSCPECGADVATSLRQSGGGNARTSGYAVGALVCGILSFVVCGLIGVVAIVLYFPAMNEVKAGKAGGPSKGFAIAGLVTGIIALGLTVLALGFVLLMGFA